MKTYQVNNATITKSIKVENDPKRSGLLIARCYNKNNNQISTVWGKKNQAYIQEMMKG